MCGELGLEGGALLRERGPRRRVDVLEQVQRVELRLLAHRLAGPPGELLGGLADLGAELVGERTLGHQVLLEALDRVAPILASDRDEGAVTATRANADRAGVGGRIHVARAAFHDLEPPAGPGLVVMNPPYGDRIEASGGPARTYKHIGEVLMRAKRSAA